MCVRDVKARTRVNLPENQEITENNTKASAAAQRPRKAEEMKSKKNALCVGWLSMSSVYMRSAHTHTHIAPLTLIVNSKVMQILLVLSFDAECKLSVSDDDSSTVAVVVVSLG